MICTMNDIAEMVDERTDGQGILFPADVREMLLDMRDTYESEIKAACATIDVLRNEESALMAHKDAKIARLTDALNEAHAKNAEWSKVCDALNRRVDELEDESIKSI